MAGIFRRGRESADIGGVVMENYLKILLEQIRCKKACPRIEQEVRAHIEDQAKANRTEWMMNEEEAVKRAVQDMGDPVETGASLDKIHRPKMAWDFIAVMAVIAVASLAVHLAIGVGAEEIGSQTRGQYLLGAAAYTGIGFLLMLLVYRLDYSFLAGRGMLFAGIFLALITVGIFFTGVMVNGSTLFLSVGGVRISIPHLMFLYLPVFGAVLHQLHGSGWTGVLKSMPFLLYPVWLAMKIPRMGFAMLLFFMMSVMLTAAVGCGWFRISKKVFLGIYWGIVLCIPVLLAFLVASGAAPVPSYQQERLRAVIGGGFREHDYMTKVLLECVQNSRLFGAGGAEAVGQLPGYYSDYMLAFLSSCYGIAAYLGVCLLVGAAAVKALRISFGQSNRLGMMVGFSSGLVLFSNLIFHIVGNMGILPRTETFLPFFSYTGTGIIVSYIMAGIALSVYRYKNILPEDNRRVKAKRQYT